MFDKKFSSWFYLFFKNGIEMEFYKRDRYLLFIF